jgi:hypothetical protein
VAVFLNAIDLQMRYGDPDVQRFVVRPAVRLMAEYGPERTVCLGATSHSSYTARDRDRLRQQQLENLGWRFHRIWSTDWFMRKEEEIQRALRAFQEAVQFADALDRGLVTNNHNGNDSHREHSAATPARGQRPQIPIRTSIAQ